MFTRVYTTTSSISTSRAGFLSTTSIRINTPIVTEKKSIWNILQDAQRYFCYFTSRNKPASTQYLKSYSLFYRFISVPILFILIQFPTLVNNISGYQGDRAPPAIHNIYFLYAQAILAPSEGFWTAIIWVFTDEEVRDEWCAFLRKCRKHPVIEAILAF